MLGLTLKLTPYQVKVLISIDHWEHHRKGTWYRYFDTPYFVASANKLMEKRLVRHINDPKKPRWETTDEGKSVIKLVREQAEELINLIDYQPETNVALRTGKRSRVRSRASGSV